MFIRSILVILTHVLVTLQLVNINLRVNRKSYRIDWRINLSRPAITADKYERYHAMRKDAKGPFEASLL